MRVIDLIKRNLIGFGLSLLLLFLGVIGANSVSSGGIVELFTAEDNSDFVLNLSTELIGASLTFFLFTLVADGIRQQQTEAEEIDDLIEQTKAHNSNAKLALSKLKKKNKLARKDSVLRGKVLKSVHWQDADLRDCGLQGAILTQANLTNADLRGADLSNAHLLGVVGFETARKDQDTKLDDATMPNGNKYEVNDVR